MPDTDTSSILNALLQALQALGAGAGQPGTGGFGEGAAAAAPPPGTVNGHPTQFNNTVLTGTSPMIAPAFRHLFTPEQIAQYGMPGPMNVYTMGADGTVKTTTQDWKTPQTPQTPGTGGTGGTTTPPPENTLPDPLEVPDDNMQSQEVLGNPFYGSGLSEKEFVKRYPEYSIGGSKYRAEWG